MSDNVFSEATAEAESWLRQYRQRYDCRHRPIEKGRGFRGRDWLCEEVFGNLHKHPAVQRYVLTGEVPSTVDGWPIDPALVALLLRVDEFYRFRPIGDVLAGLYRSWQEARSDERVQALLGGEELTEVVDYRTGEVYSVRTEYDPGAWDGVSRAHEVPYPGVIRGGVADRAVQRIRAPVVLPYRDEA